MIDLLIKTQTEWHFIDSGVKSPESHMVHDHLALDEMPLKYDNLLSVRLFQWKQPCITFGYLLNEDRVKQWAEGKGDIPLVRRPSGGGAVFHNTRELCLTLLWSRGKNLLPDKPRDSYALIHKLILESLTEFIPNNQMSLYSPTVNSCENEPVVADFGENPNASRFSVCFDEPVCNDVMINQKKIVGGGMRLTKKAVLYQGSIQLDDHFPLHDLKHSLKTKFKTLITSS